MGKKLLDERKTNIRRYYFCSNTHKHSAGNRVILRKYNSKQRGGILRKLYICPECRDLFFKSKTHCVPMYLGNEDILIANIDSPKNHSIKCPNCGKQAVLATAEDDSRRNYFCVDCYTAIKLSTIEDGTNIGTVFPGEYEYKVIEEDE